MGHSRSIGLALLLLCNQTIEKCCCGYEMRAGRALHMAMAVIIVLFEREPL